MQIPFDIGNVPGPDMGRIARPETISEVITRSERPLLVVGSETLEDDLMDKAIEIGKKGIPIAATGHSIKGFVEKGYVENVHLFSLHDLTNRLRDPNWTGIDGKGNYDLVIFFGIIYYFASQMMSCLKNFAIDPMIRVVSIDKYYHPHARMTFPNIHPTEKDTYVNMLDKVIEHIRR